VFSIKLNRKKTRFLILPQQLVDRRRSHLRQ
jgi:hypothetical protein